MLSVIPYYLGIYAVWPPIISALYFKLKPLPYSTTLRNFLNKSKIEI